MGGHQEIQNIDYLIYFDMASLALKEKVSTISSPLLMRS